VVLTRPAKQDNPTDITADNITGLPERTSRRVFGDVIGLGLLASETLKWPVSLRFPADALDTLFPKPFPET
jgi:hypothetical protein